jgi:hypothetical protein
MPDRIRSEDHMHALANSLGKAERDLLRETEDDRLAALDEDALVDLHKRIRRARTKYVGIYRRAGSAKVSKKGGRGLAKEKNSRNAARAEVFEDALARVSAALAAAAAAEAQALKDARLAAASSPGTWPGSEQAPASGADEGAEAKVSDRRPTGPGRKKRNASSTAQGKRRQAKRDTR